MQYESGDRVRIPKSTEIWTVDGWREDSNKYWVQLGLDAATKTLVHADEIELVEKKKARDDGPFVVPEKGLM
jgi:hypothetical protein